jgi:hypothetical protein
MSQLPLSFLLAFTPLLSVSQESVLQQQQHFQSFLPSFPLPSLPPSPRHNLQPCPSITTTNSPTHKDVPQNQEDEHHPRPPPPPHCNNNTLLVLLRLVWDKISESLWSITTTTTTSSSPAAAV